MRYRIKSQTILEQPEVILEAATQEELIIKYKDLIDSMSDEDKSDNSTTKTTFLITHLKDAEVNIIEGNLQKIN